MAVSFRPLIALVMGGLTLVLLSGAMSQDPTPSSEPTLVMREGATLKDITGWFKVTIDRVEFQATDQELKLIVLENLALERIVDELDGSSLVLWQVEGTVTEYHGRNYLLVHKAFVKSAVEK